MTVGLRINGDRGKKILVGFPKTEMWLKDADVRLFSLIFRMNKLLLLLQSLRVSLQFSCNSKRSSNWERLAAYAP
jgi:hypothetical protein